MSLKDDFATLAAAYVMPMTDSEVIVASQRPELSGVFSRSDVLSTRLENSMMSRKGSSSPGSLKVAEMAARTHKVDSINITSALLGDNDFEELVESDPNVENSIKSNPYASARFETIKSNEKMGSFPTNREHMTAVRANSGSRQNTRMSGIKSRSPISKSRSPASKLREAAMTPVALSQVIHLTGDVTKDAKTLAKSPQDEVEMLAEIDHEMYGDNYITNIIEDPEYPALVESVKKLEEMKIASTAKTISPSRNSVRSALRNSPRGSPVRSAIMGDDFDGDNMVEYVPSRKSRTPSPVRNPSPVRSRTSRFTQMPKDRNLKLVCKVVSEDESSESEEEMINPSSREKWEKSASSMKKSGTPNKSPKSVTWNELL